MNSTFGPTDLPGDPGQTAPRRDPQPAAHQPGQWPAGCSSHLTNITTSEVGDESWAALQAERAERTIILGRIRARLEAEPNARTVLAAGRRWSLYIVTMAGEVASAMGAKEDTK